MAQLLWVDFDILRGLAQQPTLGTLAVDALHTANRVINTVRSVKTLSSALTITNEFFSERSDMGRQVY